MVEGIGFGLALVIGGVMCWWQLPSRPDVWRKLPRERMAGIVLGLVCLAWTVHLVSPLLEGGMAKYRVLLWPFMTVLAVGCYLHLEYLFTRALGGFLVLMTNHVMHEAFVLHAPARGVLSVVSYLLGIVGIFMISSPYHFRDVLRKMGDSARWRHGICGCLLAAGLVNLVTFLATWR